MIAPNRAHTHMHAQEAQKKQEALERLQEKEERAETHEHEAQVRVRRLQDRLDLEKRSVTFLPPPPSLNFPAPPPRAALPLHPVSLSVALSPLLFRASVLRLWPVAPRIAQHETQLTCVSPLLEPPSVSRCPGASVTQACKATAGTGKACR